MWRFPSLTPTGRVLWAVPGDARSRVTDRAASRSGFSHRPPGAARATARMPGCSASARPDTTTPPRSPVPRPLVAGGVPGLAPRRLSRRASSRGPDGPLHLRRHGPGSALDPGGGQRRCHLWVRDHRTFPGRRCRRCGRGPRPLCRSPRMGTRGGTPADGTSPEQLGRRGFSTGVLWCSRAMIVRNTSTVPTGGRSTATSGRPRSGTSPSTRSLQPPTSLITRPRLGGDGDRFHDLWQMHR